MGCKDPHIRLLIELFGLAAATCLDIFPISYFVWALAAALDDNWRTDHP